MIRAIMGWIASLLNSSMDPLKERIAQLQTENRALREENRKLKEQVLGWQLTPDRPDPSDLVPLAGIWHDGDGVVTVDLRKLNVQLAQPPSVWIPEVPPTGSMQPTFDWRHNNILIAGRDPGDHLILTRAVQVGDIIVAAVPPDMSGYYVIHRVVEMGMDGEGLYYILKGDYNPDPDRPKVRPENILWVSVGTIY